MFRISASLLTVVFLVFSYPDATAQQNNVRLTPQISGQPDRLWGYVDPEGKFLIEPQFYLAGPFIDGLALVKTTKEGRFGFIRPSGKFAFERRFRMANHFSEGKFYVTTVDTETNDEDFHSNFRLTDELFLQWCTKIDPQGRAGLNDQNVGSFIKSCHLPRQQLAAEISNILNVESEMLDQLLRRVDPL